MKKIVVIYLFLLATLIGIEISIGVLLAPVIFFPAKFIGEGVLTHFQSGQLMTQIFLKYNVLLIVVSVLVFLYEIFNLKNRTEIITMRISTFIFAIINLILAYLFVFYFTDYIVNAQLVGTLATMTDKFAMIHEQSEMAMKAMLVVQVILFFMRGFSRPKIEIIKAIKAKSYQN